MRHKIADETRHAHAVVALAEYERLRKHAFENYTTISDIIRKSIVEYLERHENEQKEDMVKGEGHESTK